MSITASRIRPALSKRTWAIGAPPHCHLFLLQSGQAMLECLDQPEIEFSGPSLLFLPATFVGHLRISAGGDGYTAKVGTDLIQRTICYPNLTVLLRPIVDRLVLAGPEMVAERFRSLVNTFTTLVEETSGESPAAEVMVGLQLAAVLLLFWRCTAIAPPTGTRLTGATTAQRFRQLVELHYRENLRIDEFARRLGVTRSHLHAACLRATGQTPLALLHDRLRDEACARLRQTDLSVEQVGYGLGFRDPGYFNRFFKRLTGYSPGAYRRDQVTVPLTAAALQSYAAWP